jgi:hypothetical protein
MGMRCSNGDIKLKITVMAIMMITVTMINHLTAAYSKHRNMRVANDSLKFYENNCLLQDYYFEIPPFPAVCIKQTTNFRNLAPLSMPDKRCYAGYFTTSCFLFWSRRHYLVSYYLVSHYLVSYYLVSDFDSFFGPNAGTASQIRARPLTFTFFPIHYLPICH